MTGTPEFPTRRPWSPDHLSNMTIAIHYTTEEDDDSSELDKSEADRVEVWSGHIASKSQRVGLEVQEYI